MYRPATNCDFADDVVIHHDGVAMEEKEKP
jgi:hypothetical protein